MKASRPDGETAARSAAGVRPGTPRHLLWIPVGACVGGFTSFVFGDLLPLPVAVYHMLYSTVVFGFLGLYVRWTDLRLGSLLRARLIPALVLGILGGGLLLRGALARPPTAPLEGGGLVFALLLQGLVYGAADGVLLFAFPWIVAWRALGAERRGWRLRATASGVALAGMLLVTTTYHLGYADFRSSRIVMPNVGAVISGLPTIVSANPVAAPVAHVILHLTAVVHSPDSDLYLPPHREPGP